MPQRTPASASTSPSATRGSGRRWRRIRTATFGVVERRVALLQQRQPASRPAERAGHGQEVARLAGARAAALRPSSSPTTVMLSIVTGDETVSPPAMSKPIRRCQLGHASVELFQVRDAGVGPQAERDERPCRDGAHRGDVARRSRPAPSSRGRARRSSCGGSGRLRSGRPSSAPRGSPAGAPRARRRRRSRWRPRPRGGAGRDRPWPTIRARRSIRPNSPSSATVRSSPPDAFSHAPS